MTAEIIGIGTELLLGQIANTNAKFISEELSQIGIAVYSHTAVGDNHTRIKSAFDHAFSKADIIIATGGLGPTLDDISKEVAADYFGLDMILHEESMRAIEKRFNNRKLPENVSRNAMIPTESIVLPNLHGSAPGVVIEKNDKILILLPGPPSEMEPMFKKYVIPYLQKKSESVFISRTLKITGIGESTLEKIIEDMVINQSNPTIAPYAKITEVHLRVTAAAKHESEAKNLLEPVIKEIYKRVGKYIYAEGDTTLAKVILDKLKKQSLTLSTAESCTGGLLAAGFIAEPGASDCFKESMITYSNESKINRLFISKDIINNHGAVSEQTALEMAKNMAKISGTDIAISTTGIAGPTGATKDKPIGLVYIGLYIKGDLKVKKFNIIGSRNEIRQRAVVYAMDMLRKNLI